MTMTATALTLFLQALSAVESGHNARAIGAAGERGAYQMTPAVVASCGGYGEREAAKEVQRIEARLIHLNIEPTPFHIALAYNAGLGAVQRGAAPVRSYQHATRVCAVLERLKKEAISDTEQPTTNQP